MSVNAGALILQMWLASMVGGAARGSGTVPRVAAAASTHVKVWYTLSPTQGWLGNVVAGPSSWYLGVGMPEGG